MKQVFVKNIYGIIKAKYLIIFTNSFKKKKLLLNNINSFSEIRSNRWVLRMNKEIAYVKWDNDVGRARASIKAREDGWNEFGKRMKMWDSSLLLLFTINM